MLRLFIAAAAALAPLSASALDWAPVAKIDLLGGQYFIAEQHTSFGGNAFWLLSPGVRLSDRDMLVPTFTGQYRRTREVRELVGGGFLTQQTLDNTAALKWVRVLNESWAIKPNVSYMREYVTEAEEEVLGKGLFDFWKTSGGVEVERRGETLRSLRTGLSAFMVRYPHYSALAASELGSEVDAGDKVLDFYGIDHSLAVEIAPSDRSLLSATLLTSVRPYRDQKVVTLEGTYSDKTRRDLYIAASLSGRTQLPTWTWGRMESVLGANLTYARLASNQSNYDAEETRFNGLYYDYNEWGGGPTFAFRWNKSLLVSGSYDYTRRDYFERPVQDESGAYVADVIRLHSHAISLSASYPLWRGLSIKAQGTYTISTSNMRFESTYRYNYRAANYFAGVGWAL